MLLEPRPSAAPRKAVMPDKFLRPYASTRWVPPRGGRPNLALARCQSVRQSGSQNYEERHVCFLWSMLVGLCAGHRVYCRAISCCRHFRRFRICFPDLCACYLGQCIVWPCAFDRIARADFGLHSHRDQFDIKRPLSKEVPEAGFKAAQITMILPPNHFLEPSPIERLDSSR